MQMLRNIFIRNIIKNFDQFSMTSRERTPAPKEFISENWNQIWIVICNYTFPIDLPNQAKNFDHQDSKIYFSACTFSFHPFRNQIGFTILQVTWVFLFVLGFFAVGHFAVRKNVSFG